MMDWLAMGGYAAYVWPAYAVFFAVLAWDWLAPSFRKRKLMRELHGRIAREQTRNTRVPRAEASA
ncbi:MAG: heme exporter protein CcmD [Xanthomonadales bacterium]|nr:heme exporter protein CcmD [Xanthomonadales bacterium]ODU93946.1 MAG: heme exporter protein CcmD [Rhodanobacter sp. SCN 66-43]OJY82653.1 MAG: heme exporter protein CcmD [Xanthomonadales bacterium 66-474]